MALPDFDDLERARLELIRFRDALSGFHIFYNDRWMPDSQAAAERAAFGSPEEASGALCQGSHLIHVAADQLMALTKTLTNPVQTAAPWACVRTMLESCALAAWLLDPSIDIRTRVQRSFAWQYEGLDQQLKYVRTSGLYHEQTPSRIEKAMDNLEDTAIKLGYQRILNRHRDRIGVGEKMLSSTEVVRKMYGNESAYRLTSSFVHGHMWAMQELSFRADPGASPTPEFDEREGVMHIVNYALPSNLILLMEMAGMIFARPVWFHSCLYGWDRILLRQIFDNWADTRAGAPTDRFWHDQTGPSVS